METIYDWLTILIFAGLIVLFLQRSAGDEEPADTIWQYLVASLGCAVANYVGNDKDGRFTDALGMTGRHLLAAALVTVVLLYIWYVLKPLEPGNPPP